MAEAVGAIRGGLVRRIVLIDEDLATVTGSGPTIRTSVQA
jgi:hypothetical protein